MFTFEVRKLFRKAFGPWVTAAPSRPQLRPCFRPMLEVLEDRCCPSGGGPDAGGGGGGGGGGSNNHTLEWRPQSGSAISSLATNWWDLNTNQQSTITPGATNPIVFDGNDSNNSIEITQALTVVSMTVKNSYTRTMTFDAGTSMTTSANDSVGGGSILTVVGPTKGDAFVLTSGANFSVAAGATLSLKDPPVVNGATSVTFIGTNDINPAGEYLNNAGTVKWTGTAAPKGQPGFTDSLLVPVLNTGTFNMDGGSGGNSDMVGGTLRIIGKDALTNNVGFYQTSGALNLTNNALLSCDDNYYQSGGSLTSDATPCQLDCSDINIAGGKVIVDTVAGSVSTLTFDATTVEFNGELDVNGLTSGGGSTRCDQLICTGAVTLGSSSRLEVYTTGTAGLGTGNRWIVMTYTSVTGDWLLIGVPTGMTPSTGSSNVLISN